MIHYHCNVKKPSFVMLTFQERWHVNVLLNGLDAKQNNYEDFDDHAVMSGALASSSSSVFSNVKVPTIYHNRLSLTWVTVLSNRT